jgi:hypothetical protein
MGIPGASPGGGRSDVCPRVDRLCLAGGAGKVPYPPLARCQDLACAKGGNSVTLTNFTYGIALIAETAAELLDGMIGLTDCRLTVQFA